VDRSLSSVLPRPRALSTLAGEFLTEIATGLDPNLLKLFYDPQTAGGLLLAIPMEKADDLLNELQRNYSRAEVIGRTSTRGQRRITVK